MLDLETALGDFLLRGEPEVPPAPTTAHAVDALEGRSDLPLDEVRRYAFADPAIAVELLGAAGALAGADPVISLTAAEAALGEIAFVRIVRAVGGRAPAPCAGPLARVRQRAWRGAVVAGMLCRELALLRGLDGEEAYACGLLHDVGRLAALAAFDRLARGTRPAHDVPVRRWERLADRWHIALGAAVADQHRLPRALFEAIAFHHPERTRLDNPGPLLRMVRSVDALVAVLVEGRDSAPGLDDADLTRQEALHLTRTVERMQDQVSALESRPPEPPAQARAHASLVALREPKGEGVRLRLAGREYAGVGFAAHQLLVSGPAPLGEGALLEVEVLDRRRASFHVRVLTVWSEGARFGAILLPVGLSGPSLAELGGTLPIGADA